MEAYLFYFLVAVVIVIILVTFILPVLPDDNDIRCTVSDIINNKLSGERLDNDVINVIRKINKIKNKSADDNSNLGMLWSCHLDNHAKAHDFYMKALDHIQRGEVENDDAVGIMYRIENIVNRKVADAATAKDKYVFPARLRQNLLPVVNATQDLTHKNALDKTLMSKMSEKKKMRDVSKNIEKKKSWKSDSQNVHDSVILRDLKSQFQYIRSQNDIIRQPYQTFGQVCHLILNFSEYNKEKYEADLLRVLERIRNNSKVLGLDICEQAYFIEIWRRIQSPANNVNRKELERSFVCSLQDCMEKNAIVCSTGRNTRLMSCLAHLDKDSKTKGIGILKSKEAIRNEILEESAKIVKKYIGDSSCGGKMGVPKYTIDHYNEGRATEKVAELEENIKTDILRLKNQFINRGLDDKKIDQILEECIAVV